MSLTSAQLLGGAIAGVALAVLAVAARRRMLAWYAAASVSWLTFGALLGATALEAAPAPFTPGMVDVEVDTWRASCGDSGCAVEATLVRCSALPPATCPALGGLVAVQLPDEPPLGARVAFRGRSSVRVSFANPGPALSWPDTRPRVRIRGEDAASTRILNSTWPSRLVTALRSAVRAAFDATLPAPHDGIARALLLGEAGAVDSDLNAAIRRSGVSHVLAVSGMHVTVLVGALVLAARVLLRLSPLAARYDSARVSAWLGVAFAPSVAWICGGSPSAVRAALTSTITFLVHALGRKPNALSVAALAVVLYGIACPRDALHPGFVLSVLATAALLAAARGAQPGLRAAFHEGVRAWLSTIPMLGVCFGEISVISLAANLFLLPIGALLIPLAVAHLFASWLSLGDVLGTGAAFAWSSGAFTGASRVCASFDPGLALPPLGPLGAFGVSLGCLALVFARGRTRIVACALSVALIAVGEWRLRRPLAAHELRVTFFDVGQGDAALLELGTGETVLIDGGGEERGVDPGARVLVPQLRARRISALDLVVMSHAHPDHYGGLAAVLQAFPVHELWQPGQADAEDPAGEAMKLVRAAAARGTRVRRAPELCAGPVRLGALRIDTLSPCPAHDSAWEANDNSLLLRIRHGERRFLFSGDVEAAAEASALERGTPLSADVLKVPHHGSRTSSSEAFVRAVKPELAVVSAGFANRHGHPHPEVRARLEALVTSVLVTAEHGGVEVLSDGRGLRVTSADGALRGVSPAQLPKR